MQTIAIGRKNETKILQEALASDEAEYLYQRPILRKAYGKKSQFLKRQRVLKNNSRGFCYPLMA